MTPWLTPRTRHALLRTRPVAYVTPCGRGLWLHGRYQTALAGLTCDAVITDPPYSARTHAGHNEGAAAANRVARRLRNARDRVAHGLTATNGGKKPLKEIEAQCERALRAGSDRRTIGYAAWSPHDVHAFMRFAHSVCRGWIVAMCDHHQHRQYTRCAERRGRYAFPPVIWYAPGSRVRMTGDGPTMWTTQIAVSRPRRMPWAKWGALPGGYEHSASPDKAQGDYRIGGKPLALMLDIVRDYSRPGDVVCDPCGGYATTGVAALREGRRFIGVEMDARRGSTGASDCRAAVGGARSMDRCH